MTQEKTLHEEALEVVREIRQSASDETETAVRAYVAGRGNGYNNGYVEGASDVLNRLGFGEDA